MRLYQEIEAYRPQNEQEAGDREAILAALRTYGPFLLERNCTLCHLTASGFIVSARGEQRRTLMVYHKIYRAWSWTGGHADGEADLLSVALREAEEETGLAGIRPLSPRIASLDILPVGAHRKNGSYVGPHLHLNAAYLLTGPEAAPLAGNADENDGARWLPAGAMEKWCSEAHMLPVYRKCLARLKQPGFEG